MTTMTVRPIRDDLTFGARVGGVTHDGLARRRPASADQRGLRGVRAVDLRGRRADPADASGAQQGLRSAQGPPEQGRAARRRRRHARRHRDAPRAERRRVPSGSAVGVLSSWLPWHFDHCYNDQLNRAGVLRAVEVPPEGGLTGFVDGIALYDAISPDAAGPDRGRDGDLRDGRDHGEPPVRPARRFRRGRAAARAPST